VERRLAIPAFSGVLVLTRETEDLRNLSRSDRRRELNGAFGVQKPNLIRNRRIVVIDDVVTHGTTMREIGRTLRKVGAKAVFAVVLAHTEASSWL